jgi:hypothetical protein
MSHTYERPVPSTYAEDPTIPNAGNTVTRKDFGTTLTDAVRENPASAALIGMGVAWLFFGGSKTSLFVSKRDDDRDRGHRNRHRSERDDYEMRFEAPRHVGRTSDRFGTMASGVGSAANDAVDAVGYGAQQAGSSIASGASSVAGAASQGYDAAASYAGDAASYIGSHAYDAGRAGSRIARSQAGHVQQTVGEFFEDQPLALGVLGLALGAGVAALLPVTDIEREYLGETSDELKAQARSLVGEKIGEAKDLAATALDEVGREAEAQGLTKAKLGEVAADLKDRVGNVASAAKESVSEASPGKL